MPVEIYPRTLFQRVLRGWWLVVVLMLLGGVAGYLAHLSRPPVYEGRASIAFAFDLARTGKISAAEEDMAMGTLAAILYYPPVPDQVIRIARIQGIDLESYPEWSKISLERKNYLWVLRLRFSNPQDAAALANIWIEKAYGQLVEAARHSEQAEGLRRSLEGLESCLQHMAVVEPSTAQCNWQSQGELQRELQALGERYLAEKQAARGLIPAVSFTMSETAVPNPQPAANDRNSMVLAGALLGFVFAAAALAGGLVERISERLHRDKPPAQPR